WIENGVRQPITFNQLGRQERAVRPRSYPRGGPRVDPMGSGVHLRGEAAPGPPRSVLLVVAPPAGWEILRERLGRAHGVVDVAVDDLEARFPRLALPRCGQHHGSTSSRASGDGTTPARFRT